MLWHEITERLNTKAFPVVGAVLGDFSSTEEILAESFALLVLKHESDFRCLRKMESDHNLKSRLLEILFRHLIGYAYRRSLKENPPYHQLDKWKYFYQLDIKQRWLLVLKQKMGWSHEKVAEVLQEDLSQITSLIFQARRSLGENHEFRA